MEQLPLNEKALETLYKRDIDAYIGYAGEVYVTVNGFDLELSDTEIYELAEAYDIDLQDKE